VRRLAVVTLAYNVVAFTGQVKLMDAKSAAASVSLLERHQFHLCTAEGRQVLEKPVLVHVPHSSTVIPPDVRSSLVLGRTASGRSSWS